MDRNKGRFSENYEILERLAKELQENRVPVDELIPRMKEALSAIKVCKDVLKETEIQLNEVSAEFAELEGGKEGGS